MRMIRDMHITLKIWPVASVKVTPIWLNRNPFFSNQCLALASNFASFICICDRIGLCQQ